jgi:hypothetical protein
MSIEPLAVIGSYRDLVVALRRRVVELDTTINGLDDITGLPDGYCTKILSLTATTYLGPLSLGLVLKSLGVKLALIPDNEALAKMRDRLPPRQGGGYGLRDAGGNGRASGRAPVRASRVTRRGL